MVVPLGVCCRLVWGVGEMWLIFVGGWLYVVYLLGFGWWLAG